MTKQKTISSLSIAAIALVAAAVPALAQGQTESNASIAVAGSTVEQTIASNRDSSAVRKSRVITPEVEPAAGSVARTGKPLVLSALKGQDNFTSATSSIQQVNFTEVAPVDPMAKKQFRADETEIKSTGHVAFVPSRGQKLPE